MKKLKIPSWAFLKKSDMQWISRSRLGWLYEHAYVDSNLTKVGYYYSQIAYQYYYHTDAPKIKMSKTFDVQTILFGRSFHQMTSQLQEKKAANVFKHWGHIQECLQHLAQEKIIIERFLKNVLQENLFPKPPSQYWIPLFVKGLRSIGDGIKE